jgi:hypothetical protein
MNEKERIALWPWSIIAILFLFIAAVSFGFMFKSVDITTVNNSSGIKTALTIDGAISRMNTWNEYPEYNIGFGLTGTFGLGGAVLTISYMNKKVRQ